MEEEYEYELLATALLESIVSQVEEEDGNSDLDIDYDGEKIILDTKKGQYIINKHNSAKEIWMVSPISGPHHFHMQDDEWVNDHDESILMVLTQEFTHHIKVNVKLTNINLPA